MNIKSQLNGQNALKTFKSFISTSSNEFGMMLTSCPSNMCQVDENMKYNYNLAPDHQNHISVDETVFKFDDQPMSSFRMEGQIYIDHFSLGQGTNIDNVKFVGIDKLYDASSSGIFTYNERTSGIVGLGPP